MSYTPFYSFTDLSNKSNFLLLVAFRLFLAVYGTKNSIYPDEYWQGTEVAYNMLYGGVKLPWEWEPNNRIRSHLYPFYLSIPLRILKFFGLDSYYFLTVNSYYFAHFLLVILGDYYYYKLGCKLVGSDSTRLSMYLYISCKFYNIHLIRCFANSTESVMYLIAFYYYIDIK